MSLSGTHSATIWSQTRFPLQTNTSPKTWPWLTHGESHSAEILHSRVRICVPFGEPNYFPPNSDSPVVDAIGLPPPAVVSQDILNSATHFPTIPFAPIRAILWLY